MPCYLFTYHTYGSWLPDRRRGFVRRHEGILLRDDELATAYRQRMTQSGVRLDYHHQRTVIDTLLSAASHLECQVHAIATDLQHVHLLASWSNSRRTWEATRASFKKAVTLRLKTEQANQKWLSRDGSRKRVRNRSHFDYLVDRYLPDHRGWKWDKRVGYLQTQQELQRRLSDEA